MAALKDDRGLTDDVPLIARADMVNLLDHEADLGELAALADEIKQQHGPLRMIVVDTLARAMAGSNENAPDDMGQLWPAPSKWANPNVRIGFGLMRRRADHLP